MLDDEQFYETLVQYGSDAILTIDEESTIRFANASVARVLGYDPDDVVGESLTTVMPDRYESAHFDAIERYVETGERGVDWNGVELHAVHRDGHEFPVSITFEEHRFDDERLFTGIIRDISDRVAYERSLEALHETTRELLGATSFDDVCRVAAMAGPTVFEADLGVVYRPDDIDGRPRAATQVTAEGVDDLPTVDETPATAQFTRSSSEKVLRCRGRDDGVTGFSHELHLGLSAGRTVVFARRTPFDDRDPRVGSILAVTIDEAFDRMAYEVERQRQNERLEEFASIVSHDLRDPLNAARAQVALARSEFDSAYLDELDAIHDRMESLVEGVLSLAKHGRMVGETEPVALAEVAREAWRPFDAEPAELVVEDDVGTVEADPERVLAVFENLFGNALDHAGADVGVRVGRLADEPGFFVEDDGPGISPAECERVFEYGYTGSDGGTGFGLYIVESIADAHGWDVVVTDADPGARFEFHGASGLAN